jgi:hypothetical protein
MSEVILDLVRTEDGRPVQPGDLIVLHVDRPDVECPYGWTKHAATGASGTFFWRIAVVNESTRIVLARPGPEPFKVDSMALWQRVDGPPTGPAVRLLGGY